MSNVATLSVPHSAAEPYVSHLPDEAVARRLIDSLIERGVDTFFGIPGGPIASLFEALRAHPQARLVESRHENHAAFAAVAYARRSGKVAAVLVTAGPGISNVVTGVASAHWENVPILVIAADVAWSSMGGLPAQHSGPEGLNAEAVLSPVTRRRVRISSERSAVPQAMFALDGARDPAHPGPALLVLPMDIASRQVETIRVEPGEVIMHHHAPRDVLVQVAHWFHRARRPLLVLGSGCLGRVTELARLVDALGVPFVTTPRAKGVLSEEHPLSLRNGGMAASRWARHYTQEGVDVALALGTDLEDTEIGPTPYVEEGGRLIHVTLRPHVINRNLPTAVGITADVSSFCVDMETIARELGSRHPHGRSLADESKKSSPFDEPSQTKTCAGFIPPRRAIEDLETACLGAHFVSDIGEHMLFALHYLTARTEHDFHIQLGLGSMGSGIGAATGLAIASPGRRVVCICGDGGMQMAGMELSTSLKLKLPIVYAIFNDGRYNMVHHGMKQLFGQAAAHDSPLVDFAQWAESLGIPSHTVRGPGEINDLLIERLLRHGGPAVLDIRIDRRQRLQGAGRVEALLSMSVPAGSATTDVEAPPTSMHTEGDTNHD